MDEEKNLYETLGVGRGAGDDAIRKAYRRLARENHPDLNPGDSEAEERFKRISRAWEVLSDPAKRRDYDEFGEISLEGGFDPDAAREAREAFGDRFGTRGYTGAQGTHESFQFGDLDDLLGRLFADGDQGVAGAFAARGPDLETHLDLEFRDAVLGGEKTLNLSRPTPDGHSLPETITVRIPPGVDTDGRLRLPSKGAPGFGGGPAGDLWVSLRVRAHPVFRREGRNLMLTLPVSIREAVIGAKIEVPTLDGRATVTLPPGTQGGTRLRLRGKGVPGRNRQTAGDLLVRVEIRVPRHLDADATAGLEALEPFEDPAIRKGLFS